MSRSGKTAAAAPLSLATIKPPTSTPATGCPNNGTTNGGGGGIDAPPGKSFHSTLKRFQTLDLVNSDAGSRVHFKTNGNRGGGSSGEGEGGDSDGAQNCGKVGRGESGVGVKFREPPDWILGPETSGAGPPECSCDPVEGILETTRESYPPGINGNNDSRGVPTSSNPSNPTPTLGQTSNLILGQHDCQHHVNPTTTTTTTTLSSSDESDITPHSVIFNVLSASPPQLSSFALGPLIGPSNHSDQPTKRVTPAPPVRQWFPGSSTPATEEVSRVSSSGHHQLTQKMTPISHPHQGGKQWGEAELDLIGPGILGTTTSTTTNSTNTSSSSWGKESSRGLHQHLLRATTPGPFIHHDQAATVLVPQTSRHLGGGGGQTKQPISGGGGGESKYEIPNHLPPALGHPQSQLVRVPSESSLTPESRTGSCQRISNLSATTSRRTGRKRRFLCQGLRLDFRQICVVCGFLIVVSALGVGVGVPIALEMQSQHSSGLKIDLVRKLLAEVPLIDGHNDLAWNLRKFLQNQLREINFDSDLRQLEPFSSSPWSHTDLIRLRKGGVGAQLWSAYVPCSAQHLDAVQIAVEQIDVIQRLVEKYPEHLSLVTSVTEVEKAHRDKRIASLIGVEGGHALGNSLAVLRMLYGLGARSLVLTHNCHVPWADSASSENYLPERGGLTEFGKLVVLEMNRLGMLVDLAHVSVPTMKDALAVSRSPVIFSHSAASALCNHSRNVPDDVLKLVAANGGLVMVSFYNVFIACNETASLQDVVAHITHIRDITGVDHVGIGAGFDGINFVPEGLEDVSKYPHLIETLLNDESWTELDLKKLIGINFLRVFRQVETVRDNWKKVGVGPIEEWIPKDDLQGHPTACTYYGSM